MWRLTLALVSVEVVRISRRREACSQGGYQSCDSGRERRQSPGAGACGNQKAGRRLRGRVQDLLWRMLVQLLQGRSLQHLQKGARAFAPQQVGQAYPGGLALVQQAC